MPIPAVLLRGLLAAAALLVVPPSVAAGGPPSVVVSIKPVHSLVAGVMQGVAVPTLLLSGASSPHAHSLRPSQATALHRADLVVWIGESLELFLRKPLGAMDSARVLTLSELPSIHKLPAREGGVWKEDGHAGHRMDPHLWLSPVNAVAIVNEMAQRLARLDPANESRYAANAVQVIQRIHDTEAAVATTLAPVRHQPYVVFHDAYQYFEAHYGTGAAGAVSISPDRPPSAKRLAALRARILELNVQCIFSEPQFEPRLVNTLVAGTAVRNAVLDPLGAGVETGPDAWFAIVVSMASHLRECLSR